MGEVGGGELTEPVSLIGSGVFVVLTADKMLVGSGDLAPNRASDRPVGGGDLTISSVAGGGDAMRAANPATELVAFDVRAEVRFAASNRSSLDQDACFNAAMRAATEPAAGSLIDLTTGSTFSDTVGSCVGA